MEIINNSEIAKLNITNEKAKEINNKAKHFQDILNKKVSSKTEGKIDEKLMEVCYQFESILVGQMFKVMKKTVQNKDSLLYGGQAEEIFKDMLFDEYSMMTAKTSEFGLAKDIYEQLSQKPFSAKA